MYQIIKRQTCFVLSIMMLLVFAIPLNSQNTIKEIYGRIDSCRNILKSTKVDTTKINTLNFLAKEHLKLGDWDSRVDGYELANQAYSLSEEKKYDAGLGVACLLFARKFIYFDKKDSARFFILKALAIKEKLHDYPGVLQCYVLMGTSYANPRTIPNEDIPIALDYHYKALSIAEKYGVKKDVMQAYEELGFFYYLRVEPKSLSNALKYWTMALKIAEEINDKNAIRAFEIMLGNVYYELGNDSLALTHIKGLKEKTGLGAPVINLVNSYSNLNNYHHAIYTLQRSMFNAPNVLATPTQIEEGIAFCQGMIALCFIKMSEYNYNLGIKDDSTLIFIDSAFFYFKEQNKVNDVNIFRDRGTEHNFGRLHRTRGDIYFRQNKKKDLIISELEIAKSHFENAVKEEEEKKDNEALSDRYIELGETIRSLALASSEAESLSYFKRAIFYLEKGVTAARMANTKIAIRDAYFDLATIYKNLQDFKKSFEYLELYDKMKDSVSLDQMGNKVKQLTLMGETMVAVVEENARHEKIMTKLQFDFTRKEDSLKFQEKLTASQLRQQTLLTIQNEQALKLNEATLNIANNEIALNKANLEISKKELKAEQVQRLEKEQQLLNERRQKLYFAGALALMGLIFFLIYRNIRNQQKAQSAIAAERLKTEKANAAHRMTELELQSLRSQLNPHFMFNSLNAIQELILKEDNNNSHIYLTRFSDLLRMLLDNATLPFITIRKEFSLLELYLSLEKLRIPELQYSFTIDPEIDAQNTLIPNMMLQPYIENAIWHGLSHKKANKKLSIRAKIQSNNLLFQIEDNGVGRQKALELKSLYRREHKSKGMELLSKRFSLMSKEYNTEIKTDIKDLSANNGEPLGTLVEITVPTSLAEKLNSQNNDTHHYN